VATAIDTFLLMLTIPVHQFLRRGLGEEEEHSHTPRRSRFVFCVAFLLGGAQGIKEEALSPFSGFFVQGHHARREGGKRDFCRLRKRAAGQLLTCGYLNCHCGCCYCCRCC